MSDKYVNSAGVSRIIKWALGKFAKLSHKHTKADITDFPTVITGGSQTSTSTADGGKNVYTFTTSDGKTSTFTVQNGSKGSKGDKGDQGLQGLQGVPGEKGEKGDQGLQGTAGKNGANGTTPHIDEATGNWFIGTTDTKVHAQGPQGVQGKQGATGATGAAGDKGDKGDKGDTGATGKGISSTAITYQTSSSGTAAPTNTWSSTVPATSAGQFLWTKIVITYTDKSTATFYSVSRNGSNGAAGAKGDTGEAGAKGDKGATGTRGSRWNVGTAITGTSTTATAYATGITDSLVNDMYLNSSTGLVYKCTVAGNATTAKWIYSGSIKGATGAKGDKGDTGAQGPKGNTGATGATGPQGAQGAAGAKGADGLTTKVAVGGTTFTHSNGTVTVSNEAVQKAVTPTAPVSGHVAVYDGTTGKLKDSGYPLATQVATHAGMTWSSIPFIKSDGVMEIGRYLDFHAAASENKDFGFRFDWNGTELVATGGNIRGNFIPAYCLVGTSGTINGSWYRFASFVNNMANNDLTVTFRVRQNFVTDNHYGLLTAHVRAGGTAGSVAVAELIWHYCSNNIVLSNFVLAYKSTANQKIDVELWCQAPYVWERWFFELVGVETLGDPYKYNLVALYSNNGGNGSTAITSGYTQVKSTVLSLGNDISGNATNVTGIVAVANGGTGANNKGAARKNLNTHPFVFVGNNTGNASTSPYYKAFSVTLSTWSTLVLKLAITPCNMINSWFRPFDCWLCLRANSADLYEPFTVIDEPIVSSDVYENILSRLIIAQTTTGGVGKPIDIYLKADTAWLVARIDILAASYRSDVNVTDCLDVVTIHDTPTVGVASISQPNQYTFKTGIQSTIQEVINTLTGGSARDNTKLPLTGGTVTGTLYLTKNTSASGTADNRPALIIGDVTNARLEMDNNEILAKSNGTTPTNLFINKDGGNICFGGTIYPNGNNKHNVGSTVNKWAAIYAVQGKLDNLTLGQYLTAKGYGYLDFYYHDGTSSALAASVYATDGGFNIGLKKDKAGTIGSSSARFANIYAENFNGNASSASKLGLATVGNTYTPIYLNGGSPQACARAGIEIITGNVASNAATASASASSIAGHGKALLEVWVQIKVGTVGVVSYFGRLFTNMSASVAKTTIPDTEAWYSLSAGKIQVGGAACNYTVFFFD